MSVELPSLEPERANRLTHLARAVKAAARAVVLYPGGHPTITATLGHLVELTSATALPQPLQIGVLADNLLLEGAASPRPDSAVVELAALLHGQLIGELTILPGGNADAWGAFLLLLGQSPEAVRAEGGIAQVCSTTAARHIELREIDYAEVLRERKSGHADWDQVIANCLQGQAFALDEETVQVLLEAAADSERLSDLVAALDAKGAATGQGVTSRVAALIRLLSGIIEASKQRGSEDAESVVENMASAIGRLSPDMMMGLLSERGKDQGDAATPGIVDAVVRRMPDQAIAGFVARNAMNRNVSIERVAQAFQTLVRDPDQREGLLARAHDEAAASPDGAGKHFEQHWEGVAQKLLTSYSDEAFVSDAYSQELSSTRIRAFDVEQTSDDPPERLKAWHSTVNPSELRKLDVALILDLLRIEDDDERWAGLMNAVVALIEDLLLVGDFDTAGAMVGALDNATQSGASEGRRAAALGAFEQLVNGPMTRHIVANLISVDDARFGRVKDMCVLLGDELVRRLADALVKEQRPRVRERLTAILIAFGASGRREAERLRSSKDLAARRIAIYLLREFGGDEVLPDLAGLLGDAESQVQREAVRAILNVGTEEAYRVLGQALTEGTDRSREAIMQSLASTRDERAAPLLSYIVDNVDHRGASCSVYLRAVEALGALKDPAGIPALRSALYRGEWWAPRRTASIRKSAAAALARIESPEAVAVLEEAASQGSRGLRAAAKAHLLLSRSPHDAERSGA